MSDKSPAALSVERDDDAVIHAKCLEIKAAREQVHVEGKAALLRLYKIASNDSGQCRYVADFLLNLYNGDRFHFPLTDLRGLDREIIDDCLSVLKLDARLCRNVHTYFENGCEHFERLALRWEVKNHLASH